MGWSKPSGGARRESKAKQNHVFLLKPLKAQKVAGRLLVDLERKELRIAAIGDPKVLPENQ
jgi:hypothetical protein